MSSRMCNRQAAVIATIIALMRVISDLNGLGKNMKMEKEFKLEKHVQGYYLYLVSAAELWAEFMAFIPFNPSAMKFEYLLKTTLNL